MGQCLISVNYLASANASVQSTVQIEFQTPICAKAIKY